MKTNRKENRQVVTTLATTPAHADTDTDMWPIEPLKPMKPTPDQHDGTKCDDGGNDCCAHKLWDEEQTCRDGYIPRPMKGFECHNPFCLIFTLGMGCYGCYPPTTTGTCARLHIFWDILKPFQTACAFQMDACMHTLTHTRARATKQTGQQQHNTHTCLQTQAPRWSRRSHRSHGGRITKILPSALMKKTTVAHTRHGASRRLAGTGTFPDLSRPRSVLIQDAQFTREALAATVVIHQKISVLVFVVVFFFFVLLLEAKRRHFLQFAIYLFGIPHSYIPYIRLE